jgi:hypothetical protein
MITSVNRKMKRGSVYYVRFLHGTSGAVLKGRHRRDASGGATTLAGMTTRALLAATVDHGLAHGGKLALGRLVAEGEQTLNGLLASSLLLLRYNAAMLVLQQVLLVQTACGVLGGSVVHFSL